MGELAKKRFKGIFMLGLVLVFLSFFMDWYYYSCISSAGEFIFSWAYNPIIEWTPIMQGIDNNTKPDDLEVPIMVFYVFIAALIPCIYGILFKDIENQEDVQDLTIFAYSNFLILAICGYYTLIVPVSYLIPNSLYYPFLIYQDVGMMSIYQYSIGIGIIMQLVGVFLMFPYSVFYYQTITKFEREFTIQDKVSQKIRLREIPNDIEKRIAEENSETQIEKFVLDISFEDE